MDFKSLCLEHNLHDVLISKLTPKHWETLMALDPRFRKSKLDYEFNSRRKKSKYALSQKSSG